jgi:hypothetical protein
LIHVVLYTIVSFLSVFNYMFKILVMGMGVKACVEHLPHVFIFILPSKLGCGCVNVSAARFKL